MPKIKGVDFDFGGTVLTVPPLSLGDLELLQDRIGALQIGSADPESVGTIIDSTYAALRRNYPEMTRGDVAALIDLENMVDVLECVMDVSGTKRKAAEAAKSGERGEQQLSWPRLFARICANTGWTWDYVRERVDLPMLEALEQEWLDQPPVHRLVAAYLDYKRPADVEAATDSSLLELMSAMPVNPNAPRLDNSMWEAFVAEKQGSHDG